MGSNRRHPMASCCTTPIVQNDVDTWVLTSVVNATWILKDSDLAT